MRLRNTDLEWLGSSEDGIEKENISSGSLARDRDEGRLRIVRLAVRTSADFAVDPLKQLS